MRTPLGHLTSEFRTSNPVELTVGMELGTVSTQSGHGLEKAFDRVPDATRNWVLRIEGQRVEPVGHTAFRGGQVAQVRVGGHGGFQRLQGL